VRADLKEIASVIEAGLLTKEVRRISRAVRLTVALRRRLAPRDVAAFLAFALSSSSDAFAHLSPVLPKVFSARNFRALLILEGKPAIMPESDGTQRIWASHAIFVCLNVSWLSNRMVDHSGLIGFLEANGKP
jgi:hypothetical protein